MQKVRFICLTDRYEKSLVSQITGKYKSDYIGKVARVVHKQNINVLVGTTKNLYTIEFDDGAVFCVDREQIEFIEDERW